MQLAYTFVASSLALCAALGSVAAAPAGTTPDTKQPITPADTKVAVKAKKHGAFLIQNVVDAYQPVTVWLDVPNGHYNAEWSEACDKITGKYRTQDNFKDEGGPLGKWASVACIARTHNKITKEELFYNYTPILIERMILLEGHVKPVKKPDDSHSDKPGKPPAKEAVKTSPNTTKPVKTEPVTKERVKTNPEPVKEPVKTNPEPVKEPVKKVDAPPRK
ncbi:hypothetical protein IE81DRAFT_343199 [Ceraceosorus guamensis]|uniref:Uncharacterized protein n=1 Tax=Ceraceosorus guamensis TaxID=1522189 RepID=A0A316VTC6_9BASI|nr:hypothetical protein IE81DRAFT_343199 [Ceraceosorus guamensis]PWN39673.1 hypothetical protein IE81DRAFT_343199 [Ceraceosorus guamensis]